MKFSVEMAENNFEQLSMGFFGTAKSSYTDL